MSFSATIDYVKYYVIEIIGKKPRFVKIAAFTTNVPRSISWEIIDNFLILK